MTLLQSYLDGFSRMSTYEAVLFGALLLALQFILGYLGWVAVRGLWRVAQGIKDRLTGKKAADEASLKHDIATRLAYMMALGRVGGFMLPIDTRREVAWRIQPMQGDVMVKSRVGIALGAVSAVTLAPAQSGTAWAWLEKPDGYAAPHLRTHAAHVLRRFVQVLLTTYENIEHPMPSATPLNTQMGLPTGLVMRTPLFEQEVLACTDDNSANRQVEANTEFTLYICLDDALLDLLLAGELRCAAQQDTSAFMTYLEQEVVTAWRRFTAR